MLWESNKSFNSSASLRGHPEHPVAGIKAVGEQEDLQTGSSPIASAGSRAVPRLPRCTGVTLRGAALGLGSSSACWGVHALGARLLQAPSRAGSSSGAEQLGASSGLSLRASLQAELTRSAAASEPELRCSTGDTRAQPLTCTISLHINLKFLIALTSVGVQMTGAGGAE